MMSSCYDSCYNVIMLWCHHVMIHVIIWWFMLGCTLWFMSWITRRQTKGCLTFKFHFCYYLYFCYSGWKAQNTPSSFYYYNFSYLTDAFIQINSGSDTCHWRVCTGFGLFLSSRSFWVLSVSRPLSLSVGSVILPNALVPSQTLRLCTLI